MSKLEIPGEDFEELVNSGKFHEVMSSQPEPTAQPPKQELPEQPIVKPAHAVLPKELPVQSVVEPALIPVVEPEPTVEYKQGSKYAGDYVDNEPVPEGGYRALAFRSPAHLLAAFNDDIQSGEVSLHKWQAEVNMELAPEIAPTSQKPLRYYLVAANGSGKDAFIIAPFSIWFILCKVKSRVIITSSSGTQLTAQTEAYIKSFAERINTKLGQAIFKIRQRYIRCNLTGSEIRMFATDEAGKAEGYHPLEPNAEMAIIKNESKSISEDIHKALKRCSGYNYWLEISSPGAPKGAFFDSTNRFKLGRRITSFDCPHISDEEREDDRISLGESSAEYRSKHLALFTSIDGEVVITSEMTDRCIKNPPTYNYPTWKKRVGIDLAAGCDETCVTITQGNKVVAEYAFREKNTIVTTAKINDFLVRQKIDKESKLIYADDGGIGHGIVDNLIDMGWHINRIFNQSPAYNKKRYGNKGGELWFRAKRVIEEGLFDLRGLSDKTIQQLTNRKYKQPAGGRMFLQPKREAKSEGFDSPDRADAFVLSLTELTIEDFLGENKHVEDDEKPKRKRLNSDEEVMTYYDGITFGEYDMIQSGGGKKIKIRNSMQVAMHLSNNEQEEINYGNN